MLTLLIAQARTTFASVSISKKRLHTLSGLRQMYRSPSHRAALSSSLMRRCFPVHLSSSPSCSTSLTVSPIATTVWPFRELGPEPSLARRLIRITGLNIEQYKLPDLKTAASRQAHDQTFVSAPKKKTQLRLNDATRLSRRPPRNLGTTTAVRRIREG